MPQANPTEIPTTQQVDAKVSVKHEPMAMKEATTFRRAVALISCMSQDSADVGVIANLISRRMTSPRRGDEQLIKKAIRYLRINKEPTHGIDLSSGEAELSAQVPPHLTAVAMLVQITQSDHFG